MSMLLRRAFTGGKSPVIADMFAVNLWTGNGSSKTITSGVDISSGGAIWMKARATAYDHSIISTATWSAGDNAVLYPNQNYARQGYTDYITAIGASGFTLGSAAIVNQSGNTFAGWSFKKAPRFFDCGAYTGTGNSRYIPHALGVEPALVMVKCTSNASVDWYVYHRDIIARGFTSYYLKLNSATSFLNDSTVFYGVMATSSDFYVGIHAGVNQIGTNYQWFAWAHDTSSDGVCISGGYAGNGSSSGPTVTLGWEPQFVLIKIIGGTSDWIMVDSTRGFSSFAFSPNTAAGESALSTLTTTSTGFTLTTSDVRVNASGGEYSFFAIRKP